MASAKPRYESKSVWLQRAVLVLCFAATSTKPSLALAYLVNHGLTSIPHLTFWCIWTFAHVWFSYLFHPEWKIPLSSFPYRCSYFCILNLCIFQDFVLTAFSGILSMVKAWKVSFTQKTPQICKLLFSVNKILVLVFIQTSTPFLLLPFWTSLRCFPEIANSFSSLGSVLPQNSGFC